MAGLPVPASQARETVGGASGPFDMAGRKGMPPHSSPPPGLGHSGRAVSTGTPCRRRDGLAGAPRLGMRWVWPPLAALQVRCRWPWLIATGGRVPTVPCARMGQLGHGRRWRSARAIGIAPGAQPVAARPIAFPAAVPRPNHPAADKECPSRQHGRNAPGPAGESCVAASPSGRPYRRVHSPRPLFP